MSVFADWLDDVRKWTRSSNKKMDKPDVIDLTEHFCQHSRLLVDLSTLSDRKKFELVTEGEWAALLSA